MIFNLKLDKKEILILELIFAAALFFRLIYFYQISATPLFDPSNDQLDQGYYDQWALDIAYGDFLGKEVFYGLPLYPYLLSIFYFYLGHNIALVKFLQLILGALNCLLVYGIAKKVFNKTVALISALVISAYGVFLFYEEMLLSTGLAIFLTNLFILVFLNLLERPSYKKWAITGVIFGLSSLAQASNFLFLPFILAGAGFIFKEKKKIFFYNLSFIFGLILIIAPVTIRNYLVAQDFVLVTYHSGINFYAGNNPTSEGFFNFPPNIRASIKGMQDDSRNVAEKALGRRLKPSEISRFWFNQGIEFIRQNPVKAGQLFFKKIYFFWHGYETSDIHNFYFVKKFIPVLNFTFFNFSLIAPLGLLGIILSYKRKEAIILILFIFSTMIATASFFVTSRYRLSVVTAVAIFAVYGFFWLAQHIKERKYVRLAKPAFFLSAFYILLNLKVLNQGFSHEYFYLGNYYLKNNRFKEAEQEYKRTLNLVPDYVDAYYNLGVVYYKQYQFDLAIEYFKKALTIKPDYADVRYNLGMTYEEKGLLGLAQEEYAQAAALNPYDVDARYHLANIYYKKNMLDESIKLYKEILNISPELVQVHNALGRAYQRKGLLTNARQEFIMALQIDPLYAPARINLGEK